jgi:hypothetical protein
MLSGQKRTPGLGDPEPRWPDIVIAVATVIAAAVLAAWLLGFGFQ